MASTGHSGSHRVQSMHSSGSMTRKFGPSWKQSTGQTSTQSMYLHLMQLSVTTNVMIYPSSALLNVTTILFCQTISRFRSTFQLSEMMILAPGAAVRIVLPQRKFAAGKCQVRPRNRGFIVQADLQTFRSRREFRLQQFGAEHHMHLVG